MSEQSYSKKITVTADVEFVYKAITKEIDKWWTINSNDAVNVGDILTVKFGEPYFMSMQVEDSIPNKLLVWKVVSANMFVEGSGINNDEWVGTKIHWKLSGAERGSDISLYHEGLIPSFDCYDICKDGWDYFLGSLKAFLDTGTGSPHKDLVES